MFPISRCPYLLKLPADLLRGSLMIVLTPALEAYTVVLVLLLHLLVNEMRGPASVLTV